MMTEQDPQQLFLMLTALLQQKKGSDIILNANAKPALKINGKLHYVDAPPLTSDSIEQILKVLMSDSQYQQFHQQSDVNVMLSYPGEIHFRTNIYRQRGELGAVMRLIPAEIPTMAELRLPEEVMQTLAMQKRGLVLFSGISDVGKSTSLAAMIAYRNQHASEHIVTIESPIEFIHHNKQSIITQREVGLDTESYQVALRSALRQSPDVLLVGEILDDTVMKQTLAFANTGHIVFASIHAVSAKGTLERIVSTFSPKAREQLLLDLSNNLQAIITQRLLERADGEGRIVALEILRNTPYIKQLIREGRLEEIPQAMARTTRKEGGMLMEQSLFELYETGEINFEEALAYTDSPDSFRLKLRAESMRPLPESLYAAENEWDLERGIADKRRSETWGSYSADD